MSTLADSGQTYEHEWPYGGAIQVGLERPYNIAGCSAFHFDEDRILKNLLGDHAVVVVMGIGEEFFLAGPADCLSAEDRKPIEASHALLVTGSAVVSGERNFRLRNSWGGGWADAGNLWVRRSYLTGGIFLELRGGV